MYAFIFLRFENERLRSPEYAAVLQNMLPSRTRSIRIYILEYLVLKKTALVAKYLNGTICIPDLNSGWAINNFGC
jgi:hypothetical protein